MVKLTPSRRPCLCSCAHTLLQARTPPPRGHEGKELTSTLKKNLRDQHKTHKLNYNMLMNKAKTPRTNNQKSSASLFLFIFYVLFYVFVICMTPSILMENLKKQTRTKTINTNQINHFKKQTHTETIS